jgi:tetratricopeptide (TPR) repeat protein
MRKFYLATVAVLILMATTDAIRADVWPIPQNLEKAKRVRLDRLAWIKRTLADPYDTVGKKDPRWDEIVHELMKVAVSYFDRMDDGPVQDDVFRLAKRAIDSGCNDPIVLYIYARASSGRLFPGLAEADARFEAAAKALESSKYPAFRRAVALDRAATYSMYRTGMAGPRQARKYFDTALGLLPESIKNDGLNPHVRRAWLDELKFIMDGLYFVLRDSKAAYDKIDAVLEKIPEAKGLRLGLRGEFYIKYAWEARGSGFAQTVTEDGWRRFAERAAEARKALEAAWELDHGDSMAATRMITVEMALGEGNRAQMEKWFQRAMEADSDNEDACARKLLWLEPKWHGSDADMLEFGLACRDTKNWRSGIPLILPEARRRLAEYLPLEQKEEAYKDPDFWTDVRSVYLKTLEDDPENAVVRSEYAGYCYLTSHYDEAHTQFAKLGDKLAWGSRFPLAWLKEVRAFSALRAEREMRPGSSPRKGFGLLHAKYGADKAWVDVSGVARTKVAGGHLAFTTDNLPDPIFGTRKSLVIVYSVDGKIGLSTTAEYQAVSLPPKDIATAKLLEVPADGFSLLVARYGAMETWADVTDTFRRRIADGRLEASARGLPDPIDGVRKSLVLVYAWEGHVAAVILTEDDKVVLPTLQPAIGQ